MLCSRRVAASLLALLFSLSIAGCGDTWQGMKKDTGENMKGAGETLYEGGERVEPER